MVNQNRGGQIMTKTQNNKIASVREALKYVDAEFESNEHGEVTGVHVRCKGCGEKRYFHALYTIPSLYEFAGRHAVCTEIKKTLPQVQQQIEDEVWEPEGRFVSRGIKRLY
jgi:hypothetical protein